jgi:predicted AAA+ superfamily ATPase
MIKRGNYLSILRNLRDVNIIKVITGIRRAGKSTLFKQFQEELIASGIKPKNIIYLNLEEMENEALLERFLLHDYILKNTNPRQKNYVFLDEIQNVPNFEKLVDSLFVKEYIDLYITGSNAYFLSSELATLLTGRYMEIGILPFSFAEFSQNYNGAKSRQEIFEDFMLCGGFPEAANMLQTPAKNEINNYLSGIYSSILEKDIMRRNKIRSKFDFENLYRFMLDAVGSLASPNNIAGTLTKNGNKINNDTVENYLTCLSDAFLLYPVQRYDIRGKRLLQTQNKFYSVDVGLLLAVLGRDTKVNRGHLLENVVYLELLRRYKYVYVGKNAETEVDFVAKDEKGLLTYYQVSLTVRDEKTLARELSAFQNIKDNYPKYLLTLDPEEPSYSGVLQKNVIHWLLEERG